MSKPKLAVIGASHFQMPLILKAQEMGCEVHAFAWECGDVGETAADAFHPVSIVEVDQIVEECRRIGVDGICTIASDLATVAVNHATHELGLVGNSLECTRLSTDKSCMRRAFEEGGDPSPKSILVSEADAAGFDPLEHGLNYPLIVKPIDRSGSRGVTKLEAPGDPMTVGEALASAFDQGFEKSALVEEFAEGDEFSVEGVSWCGQHRILTVTRKATTGAPHFIELAHLQPASLDAATEARVRDVVIHALDTLGVEYGASHSELKIAPDGAIRLIEIGARMGGDCIGSDLVQLSTGIDFVRAVVDIALGREPNLEPTREPAAAAIRFMFEEGDFQLLDRVREDRPDLLRSIRIDEEARKISQTVTDSSTRLGHFIVSASDMQDIVPYLGDCNGAFEGVCR